MIENTGWKPVGEAFIYISPSGAVVHTLEEVLKVIGKEKEQAREKEEAAKEKEEAAKEKEEFFKEATKEKEKFAKGAAKKAKPGEKRKFEDVFSSNKKESLQGSSSKSAKPTTITSMSLDDANGNSEAAFCDEITLPVQIESAQSQPNPEDISNNDLPLDAPKNLKRVRKKRMKKTLRKG